MEILKPHCTVTMDQEIVESDEFLAFIVKSDGDVGMYYSTDAMTMGMAMQMCIREFTFLMSKISEEEQAEIHAILGGDPEITTEKEVIHDEKH